MPRSPVTTAALTALLLCCQACSGDGRQDAVTTGPGAAAAQREPDTRTQPGAGDPPGYLVYVSNEDSNDITVISGTDHAVVATIPVGKRPRGIKVSPDGGRIYVALSGAPKCPPAMSDADCAKLEADASADGIAEVDGRTRQVVRTLASGSDPEQFDVDWNTSRLYVSNEDTHTASIVDLDSGELIAAVTTGREPEGVRLSPDNSLVYVTGEADGDITVLDAGNGRLVSRIHVGMRPRNTVFTSDGRTAYVSAELGFQITIIDVASSTVTGMIQLPEGSLPMGLVLADDEQTLYVSNGRARTVMAIDLTSRTVTATVDVGTRPWGLAQSPDGRYLYSANGPSDDVTVIVADTMQVMAKIPVGKSPWGIVTGISPR